MFIQIRVARGWHFLCDQFVPRLEFSDGEIEGIQCASGRFAVFLVERAVTAEVLRGSKTLGYPPIRENPSLDEQPRANER